MPNLATLDSWCNVVGFEPTQTTHQLEPHDDDTLYLETQRFRNILLHIWNLIKSLTMASFPNIYTHRKVADTASKACEICYKPASSVLVTLENKVDIPHLRPDCGY